MRTGTTSCSRRQWEAISRSVGSLPRSAIFKNGSAGSGGGVGEGGSAVKAAKAPQQQPRDKAAVSRSQALPSRAASKPAAAKARSSVTVSRAAFK